jgi:CHASE2 domain-containing sensor protein
VVDARTILNSADVDQWNLRKKIVVIGDAVSDKRNNVVGHVPGVILQANFIEALLDTRYLKGLGPRWTFVTSFTCLLTVAFIFEGSEKLFPALFRALFFGRFSP